MSDEKKKKMKKMCVYREEYDFIQEDNSSCYKSLCNFCRKTFGISHGGLNDVKKLD